MTRAHVPAAAARRRRPAIALALALALGPTLAARPAPLAAQEPVESTVPGGSSPALVRYGKWALLAGSITMNVLAARAHERGDEEYELLRARCATDGNLCAIALDGTYADPETELRYQRSLAYDRRARVWLVAGQTALLGSAVMFIWELTRPKGPPGNIPFEPEVSATPDGTNLGVRLSF
jgi:hypothetical protein